MTATIRLTQYAHGGGCACKIPPGELETLVRGLTAAPVRDPLGERPVRVPRCTLARPIQYRASPCSRLRLASLHRFHLRFP